MTIDSLLTVSTNELRMRLAPHSDLGRKWWPITRKLGDTHRVNRLSRDLVEIKAIQQTSNCNPHVRLADLPASAYSASCVSKLISDSAAVAGRVGNQMPYLVQRPNGL
jgi:hypothetical protein